jgi:hypothetical protein
MKDGNLMLNLCRNVLFLKYLTKIIRNTGYGNIPGVRSMAKENGDGKKATKLSIPSPFPKINQHSIKPEADLTHV